MAQLKYAEGVQALLNEHRGFTFQPNLYGQSALSSQRNDRTRDSRQLIRKMNATKCTTNWRNMSFDTKNAWQSFAVAFPVPCKNSDSGFLSNYQLFIKRNSYCLLNFSIAEEFIYMPELFSKSIGSPAFELKPGINTIDLTELYIYNFGLMPAVGDSILFRAIAYAEKSGQFFPNIQGSLLVEEIYIDGFFLNLILPEIDSGIVFSIYLSKPVSKGVSYVGTKVRYMGCFTTKSFLGLTDVPGSFEGQNGNPVIVNGSGTGLEFIPPFYTYNENGDVLLTHQTQYSILQFDGSMHTINCIISSGNRSAFLYQCSLSASMIIANLAADFEVIASLNSPITDPRITNINIIRSGTDCLFIVDWVGDGQPWELLVSFAVNPVQITFPGGGGD
jgi:hypothetical protein